MAAIRFSNLNSLRMKLCCRPHGYNRTIFIRSFSPPPQLNLCLGRSVSTFPSLSPIAKNPVLNYRLHTRHQEVPDASGAGEPAVSENGVGGSDWYDMAKERLFVGLILLGWMALAQACWRVGQSILMAVGIGGVANAFAVAYIFWDAAALFLEKARCHAMVTKISLQTDDHSKIRVISEDVKSMLRSNSKVLWEKESPYILLSRLKRSYAELHMGCKLKHMSKGELYSTEQDILMQSAQIIKPHGVTMEDMICQ